MISTQSASTRPDSPSTSTKASLPASLRSGPVDCSASSPFQSRQRRAVHDPKAALDAPQAL